MPNIDQFLGAIEFILFNNKPPLFPNPYLMIRFCSKILAFVLVRSVAPCTPYAPPDMHPSCSTRLVLICNQHLLITDL